MVKSFVREGIGLESRARAADTDSSVTLTRGPFGLKAVKDIFTPELKAAYASSLKSRWLCDTIFAVFQRE